MPENQSWVLVVDDAPAVVELVKDHLESVGYSVDGANSGAEALDLVAGRSYDVVIVDVIMPGLSGFELVEALRKRGSKTPVLMLTGRREVEDVVQGLKVGADDYLTKPFHIAELEARVDALVRRGRASADATLRLGDVEVDPLKRTVVRAGREVDLTHREFDILYYLGQKMPEPVSREELLREVWGLDEDPGTNVVEVHIFNLRKKLEQEGGERLVHTVRGQGYRLQIPA
jgi:DNA-binding response OmpR family regulator